MNKLSFNLLFWAGLAILVIDLLTYYNHITYYFTTLGIVLLPISIILIIVSYFFSK
ncbi:hypothetical protein J4411_01540 [Candidatus Pacearchaeota archaeon]|nr:hypothetical protein [Candidatus Pacearchaeota archaeon]